MDQFAVHGNTDTVTPQKIVPIYFFHSLERPFCPLPSCWCHTNQEEIALLLEAIKNGEMTLQEAILFSEGRTI